MDNSIHAHLAALYGAERGGQVSAEVEEVTRKAASPTRPARELDERDALLITYADQFRQAGEAPLQTLGRFAGRYLRGMVSGLHILPFYPYTSDDGFSVVDYRSVNPALGSWEDVQRLDRDFLLMYDAVINHVSAGSAWFQGFLKDEPGCRERFITLPPDTDLSRVVRPRALPLLTPFDTARGREWVWTTFSADQVDLNYANPRVLVDILEVLLDYAARGASFVRLDAIAYLWKEVGTACIHLPQTHRVIQLMRAVLEAAGYPVKLITETNVPHEENLSYFGDGSNEAHLVYNFALPPLVLHAFYRQDARVLSEWAANLRLPSSQVTFFNFLASHDGIGLNPARGILSEGEVEALQRRALAHGGQVSYKNNPDGSQSGYELNINYLDALNDPAGNEPVARQAARFLAAQAILLAMQGLPGIYVHSLLGSRNWAEGVAQGGQKRSINRQKLPYSAVEESLAGGGLAGQVYRGYRRLLAGRAATPAFHPYGRQVLLDAGKQVFALLRASADGRSKALCLHNLSDQPRQVRLARLPSTRVDSWRDLLSGERLDLVEGAAIRLQAYQVAWWVPEGKS